MDIYNYKNNIDKKGCIVPPQNFSQFLVGNIITVNKDMMQMIGLCEKVAKSKAPIIVYGPSGVGKEMVAELIHNFSKRNDRAFIKLNCAAIPDNLIESEFFGYEAGAFTGASKNGKKGLIELAEKGTLFLDEIGEMPISLQSKLLRVLQNGTFFKIGGDKEIHSDVRIICATNKNLKGLIKKGIFREDLYFRLNVITIHIPPLNERRDDIPILVLYFINYFNKQYNTQKKISSEVMEKLIYHSWVGNVRELKNTIERLILISQNNTITKNDLSYSNFISDRNNSIEAKSTDINVQNERDDQSLKDLVSEYEKNIIVGSVKKYGSIRKAAKMLKVSPSTISRKLTTYNIKQKDNK